MALSDFERAAEGLRRDPLRVCDALGLAYRRDPPYAYIQGPPASGANSFCIFPNGTWSDFKGDCGRGRDMLDLVHLVKGGSKGEALRWANGFLGYSNDPATRPSDAELARMDAQARAAREKREQETAVKREKDARMAAAQYLKLEPAEGTTVQIYLEGRGIDFTLFDRFPGVLRFEPEARYYWEHGETADERGRMYDAHPAMVAAFYDTAGKVQALHRTFLKPDGSGKAFVGYDAKRKARSPKRMRGPKQGCVIPIHKGAGDLGVAAAVKRGRTGVLAICEGIEDALSVAMACPDYRVWAAGDKGNMASFEWPAVADAIVLVADNDGATQAEQDAAFASVALWWRDRALGRPVRVCRSAVGKDFNEWLTKT